MLPFVGDYFWFGFGWNWAKRACGWEPRGGGGEREEKRGLNSKV